MEEYEPVHTNTDMFYFDGSSSVQKAGKVLEARYSPTTTLHGGEHVIMLWFAKISKTPAIKIHARASS